MSNDAPCNTTSGSVTRHRAGVSMGMISVLGKTYRIVLVEVGIYDAVCLLDDVCVGSFGDGPLVSIDAGTGSETLLRHIARTAMRAAKTSFAPLSARARSPSK